MNRIAVLVVAVIALAAGALYLAQGDGDGGSEAFGKDPGVPGVEGEAYGTVVLISESDGNARYRAVEGQGAFIAWLDDGRYLTDAHELSRASFAGITAYFAESPSKEVEYEWSCPMFDRNGDPSDFSTRETFALSMDRLTYLKSVADDTGRTATYPEPMPVHRLSDDFVMDAIEEHLTPLTDGKTNLQKAEVVLAFVQDVISYKSDQDQYGTVEFWTTPMETIYSGYGDCEDTAALFVNIALRMGLDAGFVAFDDPVMGHMSAAVALADGESVTGTTFTYGGTTYAYVETAVDNLRYHVGNLTSKFHIGDGKWCRVTYSDGTYVGDETISIGFRTVGSRIVNYGAMME